MARKKKVGPRKKVSTVYDPVDQQIGKNLRSVRTLAGLSQEKLGASIGLSFQQIQKYEQGGNRISASVLFALAEVLKLEVDDFFEKIPSSVLAERAEIMALPQDQRRRKVKAEEHRRETLELVRAFEKIRDYRVRKSVLDMAKTLGRNTRPTY